MTLADRVEAFKRAYPKWPASWPHIGHEKGREVVYATWVIGNDYRNKTTYYGAYPAGYLQRLMALFPDKQRVLHVFAGSVPPGPYTRLDSNPTLATELVGSVYDVKALYDRQADLVAADPPYTGPDAVKYGTPMVNRGKVMRALATVTEHTGHLAWLDTTWPMHRKDQWLTVGRITVIRSTNHRVRLLSIFERTSRGDETASAVSTAPAKEHAGTALPHGSSLRQ